jgi:lipoyl synthase
MSDVGLRLPKSVEKPASPLEVRWLGRVRYNDGLALQRAVFASETNYLLLMEHTATYTLGLSASESNFLTPAAQLQANGVDVVKADRGGDVTYHGPGQLTGYPILSLPPKRGTGSGMVDTVAYVTAVEQLIIDTCTDLGLANVGRVVRCTGVWVDPESANPRKIAAIGVKLNRGRSMHGFALNVDSACLQGFTHIVPCGIADKGVTSLAAEGLNISMHTVVDAIVQRAGKLWGAGGNSRADANWRVTPDDLAPFSKGAGPGSKAVARTGGGRHQHFGSHQ